MMTIRSFNSEFSEKLNGTLAEDSVSGFYPTYVRFHIYLDDINDRIEKANQSTREELAKEDPDTAASMASQPHIDAQLYYFSDILVNGLIVSLYSYLENQVAELNKPCTNSDVWQQDRTPNNDNFGDSHFIQYVKPIYNWVLGKNFSSKSVSKQFLELLSWSKVRNDLVHKNGEVNKVSQSFLSDNQIELKDGKISMSKESALKLNRCIYEFLSDIVEEINTKHNLVTKTSI